MAYVYRHIRLDKNEPFYIGIGSDESYFRANKKSQRNIHWKRIVSKSDYEVEILIDDLTWDEAKEKEKEFIALYGRCDLSNGCLVNMTEGGDGTIGKIITDETKQKLSDSIKEWNKTRVISDIQRSKASQLFKEFNKNEEFKQKRMSALRNSDKLKEYNNSRKGIPSGYKHTEHSKKLIAQSKIGKKIAFEHYSKKCKPLLQLTLNGEFIKEWESAREVQRELKFNQGNVSKCLNGEYKQAYGFIWKYKYPERMGRKPRTINKN
jgi:hypothetical protein